MPFHLFSSSRRQFLRRTLFGAAAVLTLRRAQAAGVEANRWALFSDTHIAGNPAELKRGVNVTDHLRTSVRELIALERRPVGLIVNGDLPLDFGLPEDYAQFLEVMQPVAKAEVPMHFAMGNHDNRDVFWEALTVEASRPRPVVGKQLSIIEAPEANWFLLDSLEITHQTSGSLGEEQRAWLARELDRRRDQPALIMVHHNPTQLDPLRKIGLKDGEELLSLLTPRRQVKAVFFGHTHQWELGMHDGMHLVNLPAVSYSFAPEEPTGWVDCLLESDRMRLELRAHNPEHPAHGQKVEFVWRV